MDDGEDCIHGIDPRWCSLCKHPVQGSEVAVEIEATFAARYDGHCNGCNLPISVGQMVHRLSSGRYVHTGHE